MGDGRPAPFEEATPAHVAGGGVALQEAGEGPLNAAARGGEGSSADASADVHAGHVMLSARTGSEGAADIAGARSGNAWGAQGSQRYADFDPWGLRRGLQEYPSGDASAGGEGALGRRPSDDGMTRAYSLGNPRRSFTGTSWPALRPGSPLEGIDEGPSNVDGAASHGLGEELETACDVALVSEEGCGGYVIVDSYGQDKEPPEPSSR